MEAWVIATSLIAAYLLGCLVVGWLAGRKMQRNMDDFVVYGRRAGFFVLYLAVVSTYHSAFAFLGSGGFFYTHGIGFWDAGTWTLMMGLITYAFGTRIWALGKKFGYLTPADMLADYYESEASVFSWRSCRSCSRCSTSRCRAWGWATSCPRRQGIGFPWKFRPVS